MDETDRKELPMKKRLSGEITTYDTRAEAHEVVDKQKRYSQILECLMENGDLTAKECANIMMMKGYIPTSERNFTAPRMTEMCAKGLLDQVGSKTCAWTGKRVTVYGIRRISE